MPAHLVQIFDRSQHIIVHIVIHLSLPRWTVLTVASWILHTKDLHRHARVLKRPSAKCARDFAVVYPVTAALLPAGFGVFDHGALLAFGGRLANWVFRVNARTSFRNSRRKCTGPGRDAGLSNRGKGNRLCRSGGRRRSRQ